MRASRAMQREAPLAGSGAPQMRNQRSITIKEMKETPRMRLLKMWLD